ncbi:MAG: F0F1 ATP synthase subunit epsilon [Alphaproteobacteria bacterium]|nr:F0F1 ATP synthase subunit epsilon [Alphaproteobacteria bacterium]
MAATIEFELVSPHRLLKSEPVEMVVVPGTEGDMGILPGHAPLIGTVRPGEIVIFENGKPAERIFVAGGFVDVSPERCTVLAEEAAPVAELTRAEADDRLARAKKALEDAESDGDKSAAERKVRVAQALINIVARG